FPSSERTGETHERAHRQLDLHRCRHRPRLVHDEIVIRTGYQALHLTRDQWNTWTTEIKNGDHDTT
ncbi:hypothetical protein AB1484_38445, partial [Parafrankia sp. FMc6]|uniref:hypothetical protein n=1 Tax=Parafrankia soli TaxID=2599596 RepID=UPI0034D58C16